MNTILENEDDSPASSTVRIRGKLNEGEREAERSEYYLGKTTKTGDKGSFHGSRGCDCCNFTCLLIVSLQPL